jgi:hypothetical protein
LQLITEAKLKRWTMEADALEARSSRLDTEIEAAANSAATCFEDRWERFTEWLAVAVGLPIAFVMIVWGDFVDRIDDVIWKLKNRRG